jgi:pimeloyl-ACP methyl ester carboxylesterase
MRPHILFIHGMWSGPWVFSRWKLRFEQAGYGCTAITLPGHAQSDPDSALSGLGIADYTEAAAAEAAHFERLVLIGHSMGGLIAQQVAMRIPLSALVLVSSAAPGQIFPLRPVMLPGLVRHFARPNLWRRSFRLSFWEARYLVLNRIPKSEQATMYERFTAESGRIAYQLGFGRLNWAGSNRVEPKAIQCPVLALAGAKDRIIPAGVSRRLAALYESNADYMELARHGHWMLEEPGADDRAGEVLDWLGRAVERPKRAAAPAAP